MKTAYFKWLKINGVSISTQRNYLIRITHLLTKIKVEDINTDSIADYILELETYCKPSTVNGYLSAIQSFCCFLNKEIILPKQRKVTKKIPNYITEEYFIDHILPIVDVVFRYPLRIKALLYFMFYTGVRVSEIAILSRKDISIANKEVKIYVPKNNEEKWGFLTDKASKMIKDYFSMEGEKDSAFNSNIYTISKVFQKINIYLKDINFHPHIMRHSFAMMLLHNGFDISEISMMLGHKNIQTTMIYLHLDKEKIKQKYEERINRRSKI